MEKYRVVIIAPQGNPHIEAFSELAILLTLSLRELGFDCDLTLNELDPNALNIILGFHLLTANDIPPTIRYIVYQLEQLSENEGWFARTSTTMLPLLQNAYAVWDFSVENVAFLKQKGVDAKYFPIGYHRGLERINSAPKDIDVLFYGSRNERRNKILEELLNRGLVVKALFGVYGEERDAWIARSKVVINIHFYEATLFESVRLSYLINNGVAVITEKSSHYPWEGVPLKVVEYDTLVDETVKLVKSGEYQKYGIECQQKFREQYRMVEILRGL